ncbi:MAG: glycosyltransferase [Pseudomonadota bacterium]
MPTRVVHLISNLGTGGAETMLLRLLRSESARASDHCVISLLSDGPLAADIRALGVDLVELGARRSLSAAGLLPKLVGTLKQRQPDVIQAWMYHGNLAASVSRPFLGVHPPIIWNVRQTLQRLSNNGLLTRAVILSGSVLSRSPARVVYNSEASARQHEAWGYPRTKRCIIDNGFDVDVTTDREAARESLLRELDLSEPVLLIGRVARKDPQKDDQTLFGAFGRVAESIPNAHLVLVGKGMTLDDPEIAAYRNRSGHPDRVHCLGERRDVPDLTPAFDLAVSSSAHSEGFSNVVAEAMAAGVPALATDVGSASLILRDADRIVPPRDPERLAKAAVAMLTRTIEERHRLGEEDRRAIAERFDIGVIAARYRALWDEVLERRDDY